MPAGRMGLVAVAGRALNTAVSLLVFTFLDLLDAILCIVYKLVDFAVDWEWKPCYCSSFSSGDIVAAGGRSRRGESNVLRLCAATNRLHLDSISDTLHFRPYVLSDLASIISKKHAGQNRSPAILEIPSRKPKPRAAPRWSDCDCRTCNAWASGDESEARSLYVGAEGNLVGPEEDVLFIHGFISSSTFWTETVFGEFSEAARSRYRLLAVDLLGFGRSPKPEESLYTIREHVEMIEQSVLHRYGVRRFHIVAHSLGSVLALALAARHSDCVLSLTLLAPPYFPGGEEEAGGQAVMRRVAPRRVWPPMAFAASMACWYEHVSRTICLVICRQHRLWDFIFRLFTLNRIRTFLIEGFMCHTHNAAWHTLHNVICGNAEKMGRDLDALRDQLNCHVNIFHGENDELVPVDCSYAVRSKVPRAHLKVIRGKDHITMVVGRQKTFAAELEKIWEVAEGK